MLDQLIPIKSEIKKLISQIEEKRNKAGWFAFLHSYPNKKECSDWLNSIDNINNLEDLLAIVDSLDKFTSDKMLEPLRNILINYIITYQGVDGVVLNKKIEDKLTEIQLEEMLDATVNNKILYTAITEILTDHAAGIESDDKIEMPTFSRKSTPIQSS